VVWLRVHLLFSLCRLRSWGFAFQESCRLRICVLPSPELLRLPRSSSGPPSPPFRSVLLRECPAESRSALIPSYPFPVFPPHSRRNPFPPLLSDQKTPEPFFLLIAWLFRSRSIRAGSSSGPPFRRSVPGWSLLAPSARCGSMPDGRSV